MLEILPVEESKAVLLATREGVSLPVSAYVMTDKGEDLGYLLYRVERDTITLLVIRCVEPMLSEGLIRAALNAGVNRNAITAVCRQPDVFPLLESLGFEKEGDGYTIFIPDFFLRPCAGGCSGCH